MRWGPRTLDADVITVDGRSSDEDPIWCCRIRAHERAFVLVPWAEIDPTASCPVTGRSPTCSTGCDRTPVSARSGLSADCRPRVHPGPRSARVGSFAAMLGYLLVRLNYGRIPVLPGWPAWSRR